MKHKLFISLYGSIRSETSCTDRCSFGSNTNTINRYLKSIDLFLFYSLPNTINTLFIFQKVSDYCQEIKNRFTSTPLHSTNNSNDQDKNDPLKQKKTDKLDNLSPLVTRTQQSNNNNNNNNNNQNYNLKPRSVLAEINQTGDVINANIDKIVSSTQKNHKNYLDFVRDKNLKTNLEKSKIVTTTTTTTSNRINVVNTKLDFDFEEDEEKGNFNLDGMSLSLNIDNESKRVNIGDYCSKKFTVVATASKYKRPNDDSGNDLKEVERKKLRDKTLLEHNSKYDNRDVDNEVDVLLKSPTIPLENMPPRINLSDSDERKKIHAPVFTAPSLPVAIDIIASQSPVQPKHDAENKKNKKVFIIPKNPPSFTSKNKSGNNNKSSSTNNNNSHYISNNTLESILQKSSINNDSTTSTTTTSITKSMQHYSVSSNNSSSKSKTPIIMPKLSMSKRPKNDYFKDLDQKVRLNTPTIKIK
jgi:hypothetical protein